MKLRTEPATAKRSLLWVAAGVLWLGALAAGFVMLIEYDNSPGSMEQAPSHWPSSSKIGPRDQRATLVLFAHPRCPCTMASLGELEKIVARFPDAATFWIVFFTPAGADSDWDQTDLSSKAVSIPGVHIVRDLDGEEARRFHVATSGQTLLYSDRGDLQFSGGITFARGHSGDNPGRTSIESYLKGQLSGIQTTPVFGCPMIPASEQEED
jgi:hypothetical protein